MSRFVRASHVIWHCQYHVVWVPKYRYRVLQGPVGKEVYKCLMVFCQQLDCEVVELNVQTVHIHLLGKRDASTVLTANLLFAPASNGSGAQCNLHHTATARRRFIETDMSEFPISPIVR